MFAARLTLSGTHNTVNTTRAMHGPILPINIDRLLDHHKPCSIYTRTIGRRMGGKEARETKRKKKRALINLCHHECANFRRSRRISQRAHIAIAALCHSDRVKHMRAFCAPLNMQSYIGRWSDRYLHFGLYFYLFCKLQANGTH